MSDSLDHCCYKAENAKRMGHSLRGFPNSPHLNTIFGDNSSRDIENILTLSMGLLRWLTGKGWSKDGKDTQEHIFAQFKRMDNIIQTIVDEVIGMEQWRDLSHAKFHGAEPDKLEPSQLLQLLEEFVRSISSQNRKLDQDKNYLESERIRLHDAPKSAMHDHHREIQRKEMDFRDEKTNLHQTIDSLNTEIVRIRRDHDDVLQTLKAKHRSEREQLLIQHRDEKKHIEMQCDIEIQELQQKIRDLHIEAKREEELHTKKENELRQQHRTAEVVLKQTHMEQQTYLKKEIQSRNKALIARDTFPHITDRELKSRYCDLVREVDTLARLKWTFNHSPWPDELLREVSDSSKRLQQQILKDTIWNLLHKHIFCSPFRVFDKEGAKMEMQWNRGFGEDPESSNEFYTWPRPSFEAEWWRFDPLRRMKSALDVLPSDHDSRIERYRGFDASIERNSDEIIEQLEKVSNLEQNTLKSIQDICDKAGRMWVLFQSQRCRIMIAVHGFRSISDFSKTQNYGERSVELVVRPELRRIGDSEGELFEKVETIEGCEGDMIQYKW